MLKTHPKYGESFEGYLSRILKDHNYHVWQDKSFDFPYHVKTDVEIFDYMDSMTDVLIRIIDYFIRIDHEPEQWTAKFAGEGVSLLFSNEKDAALVQILLS